jgi:hypothetical protein
MWMAVVSYGLAWSRMVSYGLLQSLMVSYVLLWSCMVSCGLLWSLMFLYGFVWSLMVSLWSLMHFVPWTNIIPQLICYITLYVNCYVCKNTIMVPKHSAEHTSLQPSQGPYARVSWAVPCLALAAAAAGMSQDDTAALQCNVLTDKEQWRQFYMQLTVNQAGNVNSINVWLSKIFTSFTSNCVLDIFKSNKLE